MKKPNFKKWISLFLCGCLVLTGSGCSMSEISIDELMRPPQLSESRQQVQSTVSGLLGNAGQIVSPAVGEHRSSINLADLNGDGQNEDGPDADAPPVVLPGQRPLGDDLPDAVPPHLRGPQVAPEDDEPSPDDIDAEDSGLMGVDLLVSVFGARVIDERSPDAAPNPGT